MKRGIRYDVNTLCRTCLQVLSDDTLDTTKHDIFLTPEIVKKLVLCTALTVEPQDGYPKHLCDSCYVKVNAFHQFQTQCVESAKRFGELLKLPFEDDLFGCELETHSKIEMIIEEANVLFKAEPSAELNNLDKVVSNYYSATPIEKTKTNQQQRGRSTRKKVSKTKKMVEAVSFEVLPKELKIHDESLDFEVEISNDTKSSDCWNIDLSEKEYDTLIGKQLENKDDVAKSKNCRRKPKKSKTNCESATNAIRHVCPESGCSRAYKNKSTLNMHLRIFHKLGPDIKSHICEICGKVFKHSKILNVHRYTHKDPSELPFPCELAPDCQRRFARKDKLKTHMLRHSGVKNFVCPHCGMRKTTRNELKIHINYHTLERTWPCRYCEHVCNNAGNLKMHVRTVHERAKDYACRYCERNFAKPDTRKYHEMTHTGEKPNECAECGKRFTQPAALRTHTKTQHERRQEIAKPTGRMTKSDGDPVISLNQLS